VKKKLAVARKTACIFLLRILPAYPFTAPHYKPAPGSHPRVSGTLDMANDGLRTHYPYGGAMSPRGLSPRPLYDFPSPTSNYASGIPATSPSFFPMAYNISPRFGGSAFIPSGDVFADPRNPSDAPYTPRALKTRNSEALYRDPVAVHLLVETAMIDSQNFDILSVEEVEALKQEQKGLDGRLGTTRKRLESETKIRDAARSLHRLNSKSEKGHTRGLSSRGSNTKGTLVKAEEELDASNKKVEELTQELLEIESRMRLIDMQLLMHTAAVLQLTHNGPRKRKQNADVANGGDRRPDSPASIYTYENDRRTSVGEDGFDERSFYRSPENLDGLMKALQNGTHHQPPSMSQDSETLNMMGKRLKELNERLRQLIVQANPDQHDEFPLPPQQSGSTPDAAALERQLDLLDQGLRDISAEQSAKMTTVGSMTAAEERLEGINNQLYAMLSRSDDNVPPPPSVTGSGFQAQLDYMEDSFYSIERLQYALNDQLDELRTETSHNDEVEKYETMLRGLWETMQKGEEEARERKRERRRLLAEDPDNNEELSPDEDFVANEQFSLIAFSSKVQTLFRHATSLKDKQSILIRQIKQQRELNSKSDAQREEQVNRLNEQVLSARSEKKTMEAELDRAMGQLQQFDAGKVQVDNESLRDMQERNAALENTVREIEEKRAAYEAQLREAGERSMAYEAQIRDSEEQSLALEAQIRDSEERGLAFEAQIRDAQDRIFTLEAQLRDAQDEARVEAATIQAELAQSASKIDEASAALLAATTEKEAAEARTKQTATALSTKEEELRDLESEVVRLTTELTFAKAELDGAYGTRAERAAESGAYSKKELEELSTRNAALVAEIAALQKISEAASQSELEARDSERSLKAELAGMAQDYEALTRDAIQNEKDRDALEAAIDKLRDDKETLELELSDERVRWLGIRSPSVAAGASGAAAPMAASSGIEATSIRMLREDFRKMMRDRTAEALRALRVSFYLFFLVARGLARLTYGCDSSPNKRSAASWRAWSGS